MSDLSTVKVGDWVAIHSGNGWSPSLRKAQVTRTTATQFIADDQRFNRSGRLVGSDSWNSTRAELWSPENNARLTALRVTRQLQQDRLFLREYPWSKADRATVDAVMAIVRVATEREPENTSQGRKA